ncbi:VOC family protein [Litchfieldia salsa]|uniref:Glyoxalase/Bleomycin resistance protein/Dioxygenase superfamily protein n=1 Tax=Litchfieldia salsa TaxID=930152 RepID=A0A1H0U1H9_9BACI|nr:VOC family protein [Litchfieldia salsa]SDP59696.1 Glyoxalase/Bleomycin resistance protein/Dioxygenase superfamily protein [Litchfieldia salsa]
MPCYVTRISTIELPVTNIETSVNWYAKMLNLVVQHKTEHDAMLSFNAKGVASIYLVRTDDSKRNFFENTHTNVTHSVIDLYTYDLEGFYQFLQDHNVEVGELNLTGEFGGFGFKDPDGNHLSATNIAQLGQE